MPDSIADRIEVCGLVVRCVIGILEPERAREQPVRVDLELAVDTSKAGVSGKIVDTVDYDGVSRQIAELLRFRRYRLLENAAEELAAMVIGVHPLVQGLRLRLEKPLALEGRARGAAVQISRERADYPSRKEAATFGAVDILFESRQAGLYLLHVDPGHSIPRHFHRVMRELEWLVSGTLERDGRELGGASGAPRGLDAVAWPRERVHGYRNRSDARATLFCCDSPPFIRSDEIVVDTDSVPR